MAATAKDGDIGSIIGGRVSRMDAMQQQSMAKATKARRGQMRQKITAALAGLDKDEYGECSDGIPTDPLQLAPTLPTRINCARG